MKQAIKPIAVLSETYKSQLATNEYLLILNPHEELRNKIQQVKKEFYDAYQAPTALGGKPHLTLVRFTQLALMEERIIQRLRTIAMGFCPFKVELKDYGSFPSHTVYIQVTSKLPIRGLLTEVRDIQRLMKLDKDNKPHFIDEPHIPVARKLLPWQYEKGWQEYSNRSFTGRFVADGMLLLKRRAGESGDGLPSFGREGWASRAWQISERFVFQNLPVATRQGQLFALPRA
ncbi:MAG TPA: 2'-5' RNA ligase family protein [Puia sp.]|jgi:2'-5' RNA ligase|nr:2'-5' RNA ligase family protein [Puia sp.]